MGGTGIAEAHSPRYEEAEELLEQLMTYPPEDPYPLFNRVREIAPIGRGDAPAVARQIAARGSPLSPSAAPDAMVIVDRGRVVAVNPVATKLVGVPIDPAANYRVAMNNFLATGGDGFSVFTQCTDPLGGEIDIDALVAYFEAHSPIEPGPMDRITLIP